MKYKSSLFDQARGKIGNQVASENRNGNYFRALVTPKNPKTTKQADIRSNFATNAKDWRTLTDAQRTGWTLLAKQVTLNDALGNKYEPTGSQLFQSCNSNLHSSGQPAITIAPAHPDAPPGLMGVDLAASAAKPAVAANGNQPAQPAQPEQLNLSVDGGTVGSKVIVRATPQFSAGRAFVGPSEYRIIMEFAGAQQMQNQQPSTYTETFGSLKTGAKIAVEAKAISANGFATQPIRATTIVQ